MATKIGCDRWASNHQCIEYILYSRESIIFCCTRIPPLHPTDGSTLYTHPPTTNGSTLFFDITLPPWENYELFIGIIQHYYHVASN